MILLSKKNLIKTKTSDTIVIFGTGPSINKITKDQFEYINNKCDSIAFNWFFKGGLFTKYYLIREQCVTPKKIFEDQTMDIFIEGMNNIKSIKIISAMRHRPDNFQWADNHDKINGEGIILEDVPGKVTSKDLQSDCFTYGVRHYKCTITNCIHLAISMGYKRILFAGVDLNNSGHYWLPEGKVNLMSASEGRNYNDHHLTRDKTITIIELVKNNFNIELYTVNPESELIKIIPEWIL